MIEPERDLINPGGKTALTAIFKNNIPERNESMTKQNRYLMFGAHPDDCDIKFGGTAARLIRAGHLVKFVSVSNGDCGHHVISGEELARRRYGETQAVKETAGLYEYDVMLENHDCELMPTVENRKKVIRIIREFKPDVVLGHRLCDYHADHRAAAQLVQDAAYLTQVPAFCPDTPIPEVNPVFGCVWDAFTDPRPIRPDAAVIIDDVLDEKCRMLDCHVSQVYEWLSYEISGNIIEHEKLSWEEKKAYLLENWGTRYINAANEARETLIATYGEAGKSVRYAETFELSPYGRQVSVEEFRELMRP